MHDKKVLHRDLKPLNIFMTSSGLVKLGNFGNSILIEDALIRTHIIECYNLWEVHDGAYGFKSEIWLLGVTLYYMAALKLPFEGTPMQMMRSIDEGKYSPVPSHVREDVQNLIQMMLQTEPDKRPTVDQLLN